ncbi:MAG: hypothetical protein ACK5NG_01685 [Chthoniobacterales bacterium]
MRQIPSLAASGFLLLCVFTTQSLSAASTSTSREFERRAVDLRRKQINTLRPAVTYAANPGRGFGRYPWKRNIVTTVFWVGEKPTKNNPTPNHKSSWDTKWAKNYGGLDNPDPKARKNFLPKKFIPRQNPFYVALPYNDVTLGKTKPESRRAIPWFKEAFEREGKSVCKGRWVAIRKGRRICYAQWEDCGPFRTDHWQYVFGNARPKPNLNQGAGLDISPAVRDFLGMKGKDVADWKFVDFSDVPVGPWSKYGDNNTFVLKRRGENLRTVDRNNYRSALRRR